MPFDQEVADFICEQLVEGKSLRSIIRDNKHLPSAPTIFKWLAQYEAFADQYARAREAQADTLFDDTLDIADETKEDYVKRLNFQGPLEGWEVNGEAIARSKLRIDTRKWIAGKLRPKKYGDKFEVDQNVSVAPDLMSLLDRVASGGKRMAHDDNE